MCMGEMGLQSHQSSGILSEFAEILERVVGAYQHSKI